MSDLLQFFAASAPAPGYPNTYHGTERFGGRPEWAHTWFHGTKGEPEFGERRGHGDMERVKTPPEQRDMKGMGWPQPNQMLGIHFSPLHEVAHKFAGGGIASTPSAVVHAHLHFSDPAVYRDENHLNIAVADWAARHYPHWHSDKLNGQLGWNYSDQQGTHRDFSQVPEDHRERYRLGHAAQSVLTWHPHLPEILSGFNSHLLDQGHRGIIYGNDLEGPYLTDGTRGGDAATKYITKTKDWPWGSPKSFSAIAQPADIHTTHVEHIAPWRTEPEPHERTWEDVSDQDESDEMRDRILAYHRMHGGKLPGTERTASASADRYVSCDQGHQHWGAAGAAFLLLRHTDPGDQRIRYLFQHRAPWVDHGGTWGLPGGALHHGEDSYAGARRESREEMGELPRMRKHHTVTDDHGFTVWSEHEGIDLECPLHGYSSRRGSGSRQENRSSSASSGDSLPSAPLHADDRLRSHDQTEESKAPSLRSKRTPNHNDQDMRDDLGGVDHSLSDEPVQYENDAIPDLGRYRTSYTSDSETHKFFHSFEHGSGGRHPQEGSSYISDISRHEPGVSEGQSPLPADSPSPRPPDSRYSETSGMSSRPADKSRKRSQDEDAYSGCTCDPRCHTNRRWAATTHIADVHERFEPEETDEASDYRWVTKAEADQLDMHPGVRKTWETVWRSRKSKQAAAGEDAPPWQPGVPLYHGSLHAFPVGTVLTPEGKDPGGSIFSGDYVYATTSQEAARWFGSMHDVSPLSDSDVYVHRVEPVGDVEPDDFPAAAERYPHGNYRAKALRVVDRHKMPGHWASREAAVRQVPANDGPDGAAKSMMIAIVPPAEAQDMLDAAMAPLERHTPESRDKRHITLLYLGDEDDHQPAHLEKLPELTRLWAAGQPVFHVKLQGSGTFVNDGKHVLHALADIPGGQHLRSSLENYLSGHGISYPEDHGFTPHVTLSYSKHPVRFLPAIKPAEWPCTEVWFCRGGRWQSFPLGRKAVKVP